MCHRASPPADISRSARRRSAADSTPGRPGRVRLGQGRFGTMDRRRSCVRPAGDASRRRTDDNATDARGCNALAGLPDEQRSSAPQASSRSPVRAYTTPDSVVSYCNHTQIVVCDGDDCRRHLITSSAPSVYYRCLCLCLSGSRRCRNARSPSSSSDNSIPSIVVRSRSHA